MLPDVHFRIALERLDTLRSEAEVRHLTAAPSSWRRRFARSLVRLALRFEPELAPEVRAA